MLEPEEEPGRVSARPGSQRSGRDSGHVIVPDRRGFFDYDDESPLPHLHVDPRVSEEWRGVYDAAQEEGWRPWPEEKKEERSEVRCCD